MPAPEIAPGAKPPNLHRRKTLKDACRFNCGFAPAIEEGDWVDQDRVKFSARILRKEDFLPRYIVVKPQYVSGRTRAFSAEIMLNEAGPFARNILPWGKGSDVFFFNLTAPQCAKAGLDTNDECLVTIISKA